MNVAIIGASGIGKHHAKWFHLAGCNVVAFSGTSPETCRRTETVLRELFGFQGRSYTDYRRMLETETLDIVSICSPPDTHLEQAEIALDAGLHVYCEKPFAWPSFDALTYPLPSRPSTSQPGVSHPALRRMLDDAHSVVDLADQCQRVLGFNTQYVAAESVYQSMYETHHGAFDAIESFYFLLESKGVSGRHADNEGIWIDMASHALSMIIAWMPEGILDGTSVDCRIRENETIARFHYGSASVEVVLRKSADSALRRQFGVNGFIVGYEGQADEQGRFRAFFHHGDQTAVTDDLVLKSIRRFLDAVQSGDTRPFVGGREILKNLEMTMIILERGRRIDS